MEDMDDSAQHGGHCSAFPPAQVNLTWLARGGLTAARSSQFSGTSIVAAFPSHLIQYPFSAAAL
jgi:hypothetical protein